MTYAEAIQFLCRLRMFGAKFGLENTRKLAALAGHPHERLRFIHVAGTNGKGSTCAMLESIYRTAGLRVGLFTSPHLVSFAERMQVNRQLILERDIVRLAAEMRVLLEQGWGQPAAGAHRDRAGRETPSGAAGAGGSPGAAHPTFFEVVTVMALRYFAEQGCDLVIWEAGLGGRLDATNIVLPLASVITGIDFDHEQWLGATLDQIAAEKAGIIKPGVPVITAATPGRGLEVIAETARRLEATLHVVGPSSRQLDEMPGIEPGVRDREVSTVLADGGASPAPALPLRGQHQKLNAALALATVRVLSGRLPVSDRAIADGLSRVDWPGRMQLVNTAGGQAFLLDGAHNAGSAAALRDAFTQEFPNLKPVLVLGVLADKDWLSIAKTLAPLARRLVLVPVNSARTLAPEELRPICRKANPAARTEVCSSLAAGLERIRQEPFIVITGSLYLVGEAMELLRLAPAPPSDERALNEWGGVTTARDDLRAG